jgi:hypothetical protein
MDTAIATVEEDPVEHALDLRTLDATEAVFLSTEDGNPTGD